LKLTFILIPLAAISFGGIQVAELLIAILFAYELTKIKKLEIWIGILGILSLYFVLGGISISALSQVIKAMLIPLLFIRLYAERNNYVNNRIKPINYNFLNVLILFFLLSIPLGIRLPFGAYIDADTGIFRHSVDMACFIIMSVYFFTKHSNLPIYVSMIFLLPALLLGGSRTALALAPFQLILARPWLGASLLGIILIAIFFFFDAFIFLGDLTPSSGKMFSLIELVANGTFNQILIDGSILVRIDNFQAIFSQMSGVEWLFGMQKEDIINITTATSGDVATDNIVLYKAIFFGIPFGLILILISIASIWMLSRDLPLLIVLVAYGMLQDWLSNGFSIYIIYTFLMISNPFYKDQSPSNEHS